jgi:hypothetical protein
MNLLQFVKDTYERRTSYTNTLGSSSLTSNDDDDTSELQHPDEHANNARKRGRPARPKDGYKEGHPSYGKVVRVLRPSGHKTLLEVVGGYFPRANDPDTYARYCACMLAALKPWRSLYTLKEGPETWEEAFTTFKGDADSDTIRILSNMQFYHETRDAAQQKAQSRPAAQSRAVRRQREYDEILEDQVLECDEDRKLL